MGPFGQTSAIYWSDATWRRGQIRSRPRGSMRRWCAGARRRSRARCRPPRKPCGGPTFMMRRSARPPPLCRTSPPTVSAHSPGQPSILTISRHIWRHGPSSARFGRVDGTQNIAQNSKKRGGSPMAVLRRTLNIALASACLSAIVPVIAVAQDWPTRNITVIVPVGAGSASDIVARAVMDQVGRQLGQNIIVENRTGAGGTIGANMVAKAAPDGYTVLIYGALASAHALYSKLPYDSMNDFIPVISLGQQPLVIVGAPAKGYKTLGDLIAAGKSKPGSLNFSTSGVGSASHFGAERLRAAAGFEALHIPFKGGSEAVTDVIAGRSDFSVQLTATTLQLLKDGKLTTLAVSAAKRSSMFPDVPTTIEAGLPPSSVYPFYSGVYLPAHTPQPIVDCLVAEIGKALENSDVKARLAQIGVEPMPMSQSEFAQFTKEDIAANVALVKAAKIPTQ